MGVTTLPLLDTSALTRATLARQLLLERAELTALEAIEHLMGMQSQSPLPPYLGLWSRLAGFRPEELSGLLLDRTAVRLAMMRSTVHLVSTEHAQRFRPLLTPMMHRALPAAARKQLTTVEVDDLLAQVRALTAEEPATFATMEARLGPAWPTIAPETISYAARTWLDLVQVPPRGLWGYSGPAAHVPLKDWVGPSPEVDEAEAHKDLVRGYLAAYGPASVLDVQKWSGLTRLSSVFSELAEELVLFRSAIGTVLYDLHESPRPDEDEVAIPVRFLPEWDNLLLSHADRGRVVGTEEQQRILTNNGIVRATVLVNGRVGGTWKADADGIEVELFAKPTRQVRRELNDEGGALGVLLTGGDADVRIRH